MFFIHFNEAYLQYLFSFWYFNVSTLSNKIMFESVDFGIFHYYYVFHGRVTLFFANNSLMQCRINMKFLHNLF